jgi:hypothetical protein
MASRYMRRPMFGTSLTQRKDDDVVDVAAVLLTTRVKHRWGGFMPGHKTYKRKVPCLDTKHIIVSGAADTKFHQDYFIEVPLYNEDHFLMKVLFK